MKHFRLRCINGQGALNVGRAKSMYLGSALITYSLTSASDAFSISGNLTLG